MKTSPVPKYKTNKKGVSLPEKAWREAVLKVIEQRLTTSGSWKEGESLNRSARLTFGGVTLTFTARPHGIEEAMSDGYTRPDFEIEGSNGNVTRYNVMVGIGGRSA